MTVQPLDRTDIDSVLTAMYAMVSGKAGPRDWSRQKIVFHPEARMMRTGIDAAGVSWIKIMTLDGYVENTRAYFAANDFFEVETARRIQTFGNMAHAWSVYEARIAPDDPNLERRGINSIQLYRDDKGHWRIISMIWDNERPGLKIDPNL